MGRPAKNGIYDFKRKAQKCNRTCPEYEHCAIRLAPGTKCNKRDRPEYYVKYVHIQVNGRSKRKAVYGKTPEEIRMKVAKYADVNPVSDITLGDWIDIWQSDYINETKMRPSSCRFYRSLIKHVPLSLRMKAISTIMPIDIDRLLNDLSGIKKLSPKTIRSFRTLLISCCDRAVENGVLANNFARKTKPPQLIQKEITTLTIADIHKLLMTADSGEYYDGPEQARDNIGSRYLIRQWAMVIRIALATGMRRGEVFGLTWADVDTSKAYIRVNNNLQNGKLSAPKTLKSRRCITIDNETSTKLDGWKLYQAQYADEVGDLYSNNQNLVFTNIAGKPVNFDNFRSRYFDKMIIAAGLPPTITFHSLRHTHATMLLCNGCDAKTINIVNII